MKINLMVRSSIGLCLLALACHSTLARDTPSDALRVPAAVAYSEPDPEALQTDNEGVPTLKRTGEKLVWYGKFNTPGKLTLGLIASTGRSTARPNAGSSSPSGTAAKRPLTAAKSPTTTK